EEAAAEYDSLRRLLKELPPSTTVYPGHDYGERPITTLGDEKASNPFLLQPDLNAFIALKNNWAAFKKAHGIK
ncbi:MAG: MBL fold metallo-hydrolase, partial [Chlorobium sp.]